MKLLPSQEEIAAAQRSDQTLGKGMDFALVVLVFLGIGYVVDRLLDTRPWFMIGLVIFSVVGQFIKMYYDYTAKMSVLEAQRREMSSPQTREATAK